MNNEGRCAVRKWLAGNLTPNPQELKLSGQDAKQALQILPRMSIHGSSGDANYFEGVLGILNITDSLWTSPHTAQSTFCHVLKAHHGQR